MSTSADRVFVIAEPYSRPPTNPETPARSGVLFATYRLLAAISNNVNQIARATNASGDAQPETAATLDAVRRTALRVDAALEGMVASS